MPNYTYRIVCLTQKYTRNTAINGGFCASLVNVTRSVKVHSSTMCNVLWSNVVKPELDMGPFAGSNPTQSTNSLPQSNPIHDVCLVFTSNAIHRTPGDENNFTCIRKSDQHFELMHAVSDVNNNYSDKSSSHAISYAKVNVEWKSEGPIWTRW